jgi:6-phosphogluconolactonase
MKSRPIRLNLSGFSMNMKWFPPSFSSKISIFDPRTCFWIHTCDFQGTTLTRPIHGAPPSREPACPAHPTGKVRGDASAVNRGSLDSRRAVPQHPPNMRAYVGGYTTKERNGRGEGINVYRIDEASGAWTHVQLLKDIANPSWLTLDRQGRVLYSAHGEGTEATAYAIDRDTGRLGVLNRQGTHGKNGVRLGIDGSDRFLVCANYSSGTVAVLPIEPDGSLGTLSDLVTLDGKPGPHPTEQASAHPHDIAFDPRGRFFLAPDKGLDAVFVFRVDAATGKLVAATPPSVTTRPGAGPRHAAFHPTRPYAYVLNELDSTLTTYRFDPDRGGLAPLQVISTLPPAFTGKNTTSEIAVAPSGRFVYGSNRGHDSIAIFGVDDATGVLSPVDWEPTQGKTPRFFALDPSGAWLYAANQDGDTIVAFRVDVRSGTLTPTGQIVKVGSPSAIVFG